MNYSLLHYLDFSELPGTDCDQITIRYHQIVDTLFSLMETKIQKLPPFYNVCALKTGLESFFM
jgi:hypothetical protein